MPYNPCITADIQFKSLQGDIYTDFPIIKRQQSRVNTEKNVYIKRIKSQNNSN